MNTEVIAVLGITWAAIGGLYYLIWNHVDKCHDRVEKIGAFIEAVNELKREVGGRDSGLVRELHDFKSEVRNSLFAIRESYGPSK